MDGAVDFLENADTVPTDPTAAEERVRSERPDQLEGNSLGQDGRYKILPRIGEGGFGTVYMAEQNEPVRRRVAGTSWDRGILSLFSTTLPPRPGYKEVEPGNYESNASLRSPKRNSENSRRKKKARTQVRALISEIDRA